MILLTDRQAMEAVLEFLVQGNTAQMRDPAFVQELKNWIRFGDAEAVRSGDGLSARASGNPSVPRWLGSLLFDFFFTEEAENDKYAQHVRSSAGIAVFVSGENDPPPLDRGGTCIRALRFAGNCPRRTDRTPESTGRSRGGASAVQ